MKLLFPLVTVSALVLLLGGTSSFAQELTSDEVINKHLASIAPEDKRSSIKNFYVLGDAQFKVAGAPNLLEGKFLVLSDENRSSWALTFRSNDYSMDRFVFDGKKVNVQRTNTQGRSFLAQFIYDNRRLLESGLLGSSLSKQWILLNRDPKAKYELGGSKKIDGRDTVVIEYWPKNGSDVRTKFYFDRQTFHHVRTEHIVSWSAKQGSNVDNSASQNPTVIRLTEEFSEFKKFGELTLPSVFKITYSQSGSLSLSGSSNISREAEWTIKLTSFGTNQELDEKSFSL